MRSQTIMSKQDKETLAIVNDPKVELIIILSRSGKSLKQRFLEINFSHEIWNGATVCGM